MAYERWKQGVLVLKGWGAIIRSSMIGAMLASNPHKNPRRRTPFRDLVITPADTLVGCASPTLGDSLKAGTT